MKAKWIAAAVILALLGVLGFYGYEHWNGVRTSDHDSLLALMPSAATAVIFIDANEIRSAPSLSALRAWVPKPQVDPEYAEFMKATGFDYERDLDRIAIAVLKSDTSSDLYAVGDGRFDQKKIAAYATKAGTVTKQNGRDIFSVPLSGPAHSLSFTFLSSTRLAIAEGSGAATLVSPPARYANSADWRLRFDRLAGAPLFAVVRQDAESGSALAAEAPGGLRSPQLATLLDSLQWITLAAKPEGNGLRLVADGECPSENTAKQLADMLNGLVQLAQIGLNDPKTRQQIPVAAREAYLEVLHSADIAKVDRGTSQSVRVMLDITPKFLEAATVPPEIIAPITQQTKPDKPVAKPHQKQSKPR